MHRLKFLLQLPLLFLFLFSCIEYEHSNVDYEAPVPPNIQELESETRVDTRIQLENPQVDVLWVIDNSCSMGDEQNLLAQSFPAFMEFFVESTTDYHIGVISTDMGDGGRLRTSGGYRWVDQQTLYPYDVFIAMAQMGVSGSGHEQGMDSAYAALNEEYNDGFVRESAPLYIIVISDEPDSSENITAKEFADYLFRLKVYPNVARFSGIIATRTSTCAWGPASEYSVLASLTGGQTYDICTENWEQILYEIGIESEANYNQEFFLSYIPQPDSISVTVEHNGITFTFEEELDWKYDGQRNSIVFLEYVPPESSKIHISYTIL